MGVIQSFERRLQGAVGNTFARLFGGSVHPAEVIGALQAEAESHLQQQSGRQIAPNSFTVRLGQTDRSKLGTDEATVATALTDSVREYLAEQGWETFGDVAVTLEGADNLHTGQFRVSSIINPDIVARSGRLVVDDPVPGVRPGIRPGNQPGVGAMTQDPNHPYYPPQQHQPGQPGQQGQPPQQPYHPQQPQQPYYPPQQPGQYPPQQYPPQQYPPQQYPPEQPGQYQPQYDPNQYQQPAYPAQPQYDPNQYQPQYGQPAYEEYPQPAADLICVLHLDDGSGRSYQLVQGSNVVGRGQEANFRLPDTSVSRRHIDIHFNGQYAELHDLGSTNGTTINNQGVQVFELSDGDVIRIGHSTLTFRLHG